MQCTSPLNLIHLPHPVSCGQCYPCRFNRRNEWTGRLIMESLSSPLSLFTTLTYNNDNVPMSFDSESDQVLPTLRPTDLKRFLYRLRNHAAAKFRYFAVGEYGDHTARPHYHICIFSGLDFSLDAIAKSWLKNGQEIGFTRTDILTPERCAYTARYTVKKLTSHADSRLDGRHPEFSRMSRGTKDVPGGIGRHYLGRLAEAYTTNSGSKWLAENGDISRMFRYENRIYRLDNYTANKIREELGIPTRREERIIINENAGYIPEITQEERNESSNKAINKYRQDQQRQSRSTARV